MSTENRGGEVSYKRFRPDGWPYCPRCDEDELWSPAVPATVATIVGCYRCRWRPPEPAP